MRPLDEHYPLYPVKPIATFAELLANSAERDGEALALEDLNPTPIPRLSYRQLADTVARFGRALRRQGLEEGDHVAVIGENRTQWVITYLAVVTSGMVVVPLDKSLAENEILTILDASSARGIVYSESYRDTIVTLALTLKGLKVLVDMDIPVRDGRVFSMTEMTAGESTPEGELFPGDDPDRLAVIVYTSGSMGRAKGVMLSQRNITANLTAMLSMVELVPQDRFLSVLPMHHTYECTCGVLCPLTAGASVHFARSLKTVVEDLQRVRATILLGVPLHLQIRHIRIQESEFAKTTTQKIKRHLVQEG